ncbi:MAG: hypothetical protein P8X89_21760 [Reinekea sp.]
MSGFGGASSKSADERLTAQHPWRIDPPASTLESRIQVLSTTEEIRSAQHPLIRDNFHILKRRSS